MYKENRLVITNKNERINIIHDIHQGLSENAKAQAMRSHFGRTPTIDKISARFYWYTIVKDVADYNKSCDACQKQLEIKKDISSELHCIPVPSEVMNQAGVYLFTLPEVDGFIYLVVLIDYFSKWSEAKAIKDKRASSVAQFLYEMNCRHGCFAIQINDQGWEFVTEVANQLHSRRVHVNG